MIAVRAVGGDLKGAADFTPSGQLETVALWRNGEWIEPDAPLMLEAVPAVDGHTGVLFSFDPASKTATRLADS